MDGAHRLSALIAWVNDDYGYGTISQKFYGVDKIPQSQIDAHDATKELIETEVRNYAYLLKISAEEGTGSDEERNVHWGSIAFPFQSRATIGKTGEKLRLRFTESTKAARL